MDNRNFITGGSIFQPNLAQSILGWKKLKVLQIRTIQLFKVDNGFFFHLHNLSKCVYWLKLAMVSELSDVAHEPLVFVNIILASRSIDLIWWVIILWFYYILNKVPSWSASALCLLDTITSIWRSAERGTSQSDLLRTFLLTPPQSSQSVFYWPHLGDWWRVRVLL